MTSSQQRKLEVTKVFLRSWYWGGGGYLPGGTGSGLHDVRAQAKLLGWKRKRRVGPRQTGPLLQSEELSLPL